MGKHKKTAKSEQLVSADCSKARFRDREIRDDQSWRPTVIKKLPFELEANQVASLVVDI